MGRLFTWPWCVGVSSVTWTAGPNVRASGANTMSDGSEQTFATVGGDLLSFDLALAPARGAAARIQRGLIMALHGGANAARIRLVDPDRRTWAEAQGAGAGGAQAWDNGEYWSNGKPWAATLPVGANHAPAAKGANRIRLKPTVTWGSSLEVGDWIGFAPHHFGAYMIVATSKVTGEYLIWPRLRKAVALDDIVTLAPVVVMRSRPGAFGIRRGQLTTEGMYVSLVEVLDADVRSDFPERVRLA